MFIDADIGFDPADADPMALFDTEVVAGMYSLKIVSYGAAALDRARAGEPLESAQHRYVGALETGEAANSHSGGGPRSPQAARPCPY